MQMLRIRVSARMPQRGAPTIDMTRRISSRLRDQDKVCSGPEFIEKATNIGVDNRLAYRVTASHRTLLIVARMAPGAMAARPRPGCDRVDAIAREVWADLFLPRVEIL
jgi:hypothetical protein